LLQTTPSVPPAGTGHIADDVGRMDTPIRHTCYL